MCYSSHSVCISMIILLPIFIFSKIISYERMCNLRNKVCPTSSDNYLRIKKLAIRSFCSTLCDLYLWISWPNCTPFMFICKLQLLVKILHCARLYKCMYVNTQTVEVCEEMMWILFKYMNLNYFYLSDLYLRKWLRNHFILYNIYH